MPTEEQSNAEEKYSGGAGARERAMLGIPCGCRGKNTSKSKPKAERLVGAAQQALRYKGRGLTEPVKKQIRWHHELRHSS